MNLDPIELGRLAIMQSDPLRYIERRVEHVELIDDYHFAVNVSQQFTVPFHTKKKREARTKTRLLVPLGWYPKERLPDIRVSAADNSVLPLLRRRDQGRIGAILFTVAWQQAFWSGLSEAGEHDARIIWQIVQRAVDQVVTSSRLGANLVIYRLKRYLEELSSDRRRGPEIKCFLLAILANQEFWDHLQTFAEVRLLVARMAGAPGGTYVVTVQYVERFTYSNYTTRDTIRRGLQWLGVAYTGVRREIANVGHAASLWVIFAVPDGIESVRCFWNSQADGPQPDDDVSMHVTKAALGKHLESIKDTKELEPDSAMFDIQVDPSPATAIAGLAFLLYLVSVFIWKASPSRPADGLLVDNVVSLAGLFTATPAALAGVLAYRGPTLIRYESRGPRLLVALLSVLAAALAVVVGLHGLGPFSEVLAFVVSVYSLAVAGIFLIIGLGPRWRMNERSRRLPVTRRTPPNECRRRQIRDVAICLAAWLVFVLVVARSQYVLQSEHVFGNSFPSDVWRAWWSWFGL